MLSIITHCVAIFFNVNCSCTFDYYIITSTNCFTTNHDYYTSCHTASRKTHLTCNPPYQELCNLIFLLYYLLFAYFLYFFKNQLKKVWLLADSEQVPETGPMIWIETKGSRSSSPVGLRSSNQAYNRIRTISSLDGR